MENFSKFQLSYMPSYCNPAFFQVGSKTLIGKFRIFDDQFENLDFNLDRVSFAVSFAGSFTGSFTGSPACCFNNFDTAFSIS